MAVTSDLWKQLLPDTQAALAKDWGEFRGSEDAGRLNRYGFLPGWTEAPTRGIRESASTSGDYLNRMVAGGSAGAALGSVVPGVGTAIGAAVGAGLGFHSAAYGGRRQRMNIPGDGGRFGKNYETHAFGLAPKLVEDPYKAALAMLFMSPHKKQDPYKFWSEKTTRRSRWGTSKSEKWKFGLTPYYRPMKEIGNAARRGQGFLDWTGFSGMGGDNVYRPSVLENLLSRSLYTEHRDLWEKEKGRSTTRVGDPWDLKGSGREWEETTRS